MFHISIDMKEEAGTVGGIFKYKVRCDSSAVDIDTLIRDRFDTFHHSGLFLLLFHHIHCSVDFCLLYSSAL